MSDLKILSKIQVAAPRSATLYLTQMLETWGGALLCRTAFQIVLIDSSPARYMVAGRVTDLIFKLLLIVLTDVIFNGEKNTDTHIQIFAYLVVWRDVHNVTGKHTALQVKGIPEL